VRGETRRWCPCPAGQASVAGSNGRARVAEQPSKRRRAVARGEDGECSAGSFGAVRIGFAVRRRCSTGPARSVTRRPSRERRGRGTGGDPVKIVRVSLRQQQGFAPALEQPLKYDFEGE